MKARHVAPEVAPFTLHPPARPGTQLLAFASRRLLQIKLSSGCKSDMEAKKQTPPGFELLILLNTTASQCVSRAKAATYSSPEYNPLFKRHTGVPEEGFLKRSTLSLWWIKTNPSSSRLSSPTQSFLSLSLSLCPSPPLQLRRALVNN